LGGDELSRTQGGNNNAYCQDNETNWYDWQLDERESGFLAFVQKMIAFRKQHVSFRRHNFLVGEPDANGAKDALWWHPDGREMKVEDWRQPALRAFGLLLRGDCIAGTDRRGEPLRDHTFLMLFNNDRRPVGFRLPRGEAGNPSMWTVVPEFRRGNPGTTLAPGTRLPVRPRVLTVLRASSEMTAAATGNGDARTEPPSR
ncbi:MAG TPA: glycogen debranching enzyme GlgX, partial [Rhodothermales bacterium]|nr:glycogen debranching enzyme GlgX [Rhodothermales bacterium]